MCCGELSAFRAVAGYRRGHRLFTFEDVTVTPEILEPIPETTAAERAVADLLPIAAGGRRRVPRLSACRCGFTRFAQWGRRLHAGHRARSPLPAARDSRGRSAGARVLDVGTFDGFYAFLAERRGAARVVAVDNEQYVSWIASRFGIELEPGAGFRAIAAAAEQRRRLSPVGRAGGRGPRGDVRRHLLLRHPAPRRGAADAATRAASAWRPAGRIILETYGCAASRTSRTCSSTSAATCTRATMRCTGASARRASIAWAGSPACASSSWSMRPTITGHPRIIGTLESR